LHPTNRHPWGTPMGPSRQHRCHAIVQHAACWTLPLAAGISPCTRRTPPAPACRALQPACRALQPACRALQFCYPVRFGRPRKPWPTCHCAWRCACTPLRLPSSVGYSRGTEERQSTATHSHRPPGVCRHRGSTRDSTQRRMRRRCLKSAPSLLLLPALPARARVQLNDRLCRRRGLSCS
jgi:hypothetical protein